VPESPFRAFECRIADSTLRVEYRDITTLVVDAIVSSDDIGLTMAGGVSDALVKAGGESIRREVQSKSRPVPLGSVAVTGAGSLKAKHIFHAAVLDYAHKDLTTPDLVRTVTRRCLNLCEEMGLQSIAFPALATGVAALLPERSAVAMLVETASHLSSPTSLKTITIALYPREGLPRDVLPRFYSQVRNFLERSGQVVAFSSWLEKLELAYRELRASGEADEVASVRQRLRDRKKTWEEDAISLEPRNLKDERWQRFRDDLEPELERISRLQTPFQPSLEPIPADRHAESEYIEYRLGALREMIAIRQRNVTDIETEKTRRGFSIELNRQMEQEKEQLRRLQTEIAELNESLRTSRQR